MERQVIKPEYRPISEAEAKELLKSGRARKANDMPARIFTLKITLATFFAIVFGIIGYFNLVGEPLYMSPFSKEAIVTADSSLGIAERNLLAGYAKTQDVAVLETIADSLVRHDSLGDSRLGLSVLKQLIAHEKFDKSRSFSATVERWAGTDLALRAELFWLKANLAYGEKNFEETRFYLKKVLETENRYTTESKIVLEEIEALLDTSFWPDW